MKPETDIDHCKFCKNYMDPIGCDTAKPVNGGAWCGQCQEGYSALYGAWHTSEVRALRDVLKKQYDADPIDWAGKSKPDPKETQQQFIERHCKHLHRLWLHDSYQMLEHVLEHRKAGK